MEREREEDLDKDGHTQEVFERSYHQQNETRGQR